MPNHSPLEITHADVPQREDGDAGVIAPGYNRRKSRWISGAKLWPAHEHHVRRPGWNELFFDLVFAAAISQLSNPLDSDYSFHGVVKYGFLLALVFLAWLGYTTFATQFAVDDVLQRALIVAQVFLVALMAANATGPLS